MWLEEKHNVIHGSEEEEILKMALAVGKELWQKHLFPLVKDYCKSCDIEDPRTAVEAVRLWLNVHAEQRRVIDEEDGIKNIYECCNCIYWKEHAPESDSDGHCTKYGQETYADDGCSNIELK